MAITRVWLDERKEDCTMCGLCQSICPKIFIVPEKMIVKDNVELTCQSEIFKAAESCPVSVIALELDNSGKRNNIEQQ